jgi:hypothetical protein
VPLVLRLSKDEQGPWGRSPCATDTQRQQQATGRQLTLSPSERGATLWCVKRQIQRADVLRPRFARRILAFLGKLHQELWLSFESTSVNFTLEFSHEPKRP